MVIKLRFAVKRNEKRALLLKIKTTVNVMGLFMIAHYKTLDMYDAVDRNGLRKFNYILKLLLKAPAIGFIKQ